MTNCMRGMVESELGAYVTHYVTLELYTCILYLAVEFIFSVKFVVSLESVCV